MTQVSDFQTKGFLVVPKILSETVIQEVSQHCDKLSYSKAGTRNLLNQEWCQQIVSKVSEQLKVKGLMPGSLIPVQCTYFEKSIDNNWLVALHRDSFIPVKKRIDATEWTKWSVKEEINYVQPPQQVLNSLIAVRIHLEKNDTENGPLEVISGSHNMENTNGSRIVCSVPKGGALVLHPMLLHASSKMRLGKRRVLHFLFGPEFLPDDAEWAFTT